MDPSHRGTYRSASNCNTDDGEVRIVVDIFDQTPPNYNNAVCRNDVFGAPATRRPEIDLNNPAQQEENNPGQVPVVDAPVQQGPVHDYTGSNYGSGKYGSGNYSSSNYERSKYGNYGGHSSGGGYVDWTRGSIDVAPDGKLAFYENAHPPTTPVHSHDGTTGFDLNAAVREAQERDEAYCQERLENLRKGKAMEDHDQFLNMSFGNSSPAEDPSDCKLWND